jgi:hypothetical protein
MQHTYRPRSITVEAIQWLGETNCDEVFEFIGWEHSTDETDHSVIYLPTAEGTATVHHGDWVIREGEDTYTVASEHEFAERYEPATAEAPES